MLNDETSLNVLSKEFIDTDDQLTLEGLGSFSPLRFLPSAVLGQRPSFTANPNYINLTSSSSELLPTSYYMLP